MVLQSPFVFTSNMTKTMTEEDLEKFKLICEISHEAISNIGCKGPSMSSSEISE